MTHGLRTAGVDQYKRILGHGHGTKETRMTTEANHRQLILSRAKGAEEGRKETRLKQNIFRTFYLQLKGRLEIPFGCGWVSISSLKAKSSSND